MPVTAEAAERPASARYVRRIAAAKSERQRVNVTYDFIRALIRQLPDHEQDAAWGVLLSSLRAHATRLEREVKR